MVAKRSQSVCSIQTFQESEDRYRADARVKNTERIIQALREKGMKVDQDS
jgi:hypothetical protein